MPLLSTFGAASARSFGGIGAAAAGAGLDVDEVFGTFVDDATGSGSLTINNGIDLSGEGGIVWVKSRNNSHNHYIFDPNIGSGGYVIPNSNTVGLTGANYTFTSTGLTDAYNNYSSNEAVWWTFRKAPKFFDVKTVTHTSGSDTVVSFSGLGTIGMVIAKKTTATENWFVSHRYNNSKYLMLNSTAAEANVTGNYGISGTNFTIQQGLSSGTYVLYAFAHNNSDGEFGPDADQDIIKCGTYTGGSSNSDQLGDLVNLGFEPQWIMVKNAEQTPYGNFGWYMFDAMRGITTTSNDPGKDAYILANASDDEDATSDYINLEANGFRPKGGHATNSHGKKYIYMAIRRGPLAEPTSATDVFAIDTGTGDHNASFPIDLTITKRRVSGASTYVMTRLTGDRYLATNSTSVESSFNFDNLFDDMTGVDFTGGSGWHSTSDTIGWMWKRAPSYFDVLCYTGTGSAGLTVNHNLGVVPEMMWCKNRDGSGSSWVVYHKDLDGTNAATKYLYLNSTDAVASYTGHFNDTQPTSSVITLGTGSGAINYSGRKHIIYLFASVAGVSKVGSVSHSFNSTTNVDCGFSSGARFVLVKSTATGDWYVWDSTRGIVSGNDPYVLLNSTAAEVTNTDFIDPHSSGFTVTAGYQNNLSEYIFYAIA